jgi:hypothetical protein
MWLCLSVPLIIQSDPDPENFGVVNAQTVICHCLDPTLWDTLQHCWMVKHQNILSEIKWSIFHHDWLLGFEDILDACINNSWYDVNNIFERYALIFIFCLTASD